MSKGAGGSRGTGGASVNTKVYTDVKGISKDVQEYIRIIQNTDPSKSYPDRYYELQDKVYEQYQEKAALKPTTLKTDEERAAIADYQRWGFEDLNENLRSGKSLTKEQSDMVRQIDKIMSRTKLTKDTIVYRGGAPSRNMAEKGYSSTSTNPYQASRFTEGKTLYAYRIPKGTSVLVIGGAEDEIVLPRGINLKKYRIM